MLPHCKNIAQRLSYRMDEITQIPIKTVKHAGLALKELRKTLGMTQNDLARQSGAAQSSISDIETGAVVPGLDTYIRLLDVLNSSLRVTSQTNDGGKV